MRISFPLFQSHLDLAHEYWSKILQFGDIAIDATCGNGFDTLKLCQLALSIDKGKIYAFDIQEEAIYSTRKLLETHLPFEQINRIELALRCHSTFPDILQPYSVKLIVYNLGYLPGGNKNLTTDRKTTLQSMHQALNLIQPGGAISVTCYSGHSEGAIEQELLLSFFSHLSPKEWSCCQHVWSNRNRSPSLFFIQRAKPTTVR